VLAEALRPFAGAAGPAALARVLEERFEPEASRERDWRAGDRPGTAHGPGEGASS
jgi:hypothetical protein